MLLVCFMVIVMTKTLIIYCEGTKMISKHKYDTFLGVFGNNIKRALERMDSIVKER